MTPDTDTSAPDDSAPLSMAEGIAMLAPSIDENTGKEKPVPQNSEPDDIKDRLEDPDAYDDDDDLDASAADEGDDDDVDETDDQEQSDEEPDPKADHQFAADQAKVKLEDGRVVTLAALKAELKEGTLRQSDYTTKTQEHARAVEQFKAEKQNVEQYVQKVNEDRKFLAKLAEQFMPTPPPNSLLDPSSPDYNPTHHYQWQNAYQEQMKALGSVHQQLQEADQRVQESQQREFLETRKVQQAKLLEIRPEFKDPKVQERFWADVEAAGTEYGFTRAEVEQLNDHRDYLVLQDALKYRRLMRKQARAKTKGEGKPPVLTGSARRAPNQVRQDDFQTSMKRLSKSNSFKDGKAALIALERTRGNRN